MRHLILTLLLVLPLPGAAQPGTDAEATDWYTVELIVFEQAGDRNVPPPDPVVPDTSGAVLLEERFDERLTGDERTTPLFPLPDALRFLPAPPDTRTLGEARDRLERSPRYRPILRMAWRQRVGAFRDPLPVRVHGGAELGRLPPEAVTATTLTRPGLEEDGRKAADPRAIEEVDGTVSLVRGRYLHLNVDLVFREPRGSLVTPGAVPAREDAGPYAAYPTWHIAERREIQPDKLQYFDHRRFGVIAVVTPWLAPITGPEADGQSLDGNTDTR